MTALVSKEVRVQFNYIYSPEGNCIGRRVLIMCDILVEYKASIDCFTSTISVDSKVDENSTYALTGRLCALLKNVSLLSGF